jgi:hypothetical protein
MKDLSVEISVEGTEELKKLLYLAIEQVEQLQRTLSQINETKIQIVRHNSQKQQLETFDPKM